MIAMARIVANSEKKKANTKPMPIFAKANGSSSFIGPMKVSWLHINSP